MVSAEDARAQQQTRRPPLLLLSIDGTDELMDGQRDGHPTITHTLILIRMRQRQ